MPSSDIRGVVSFQILFISYFIFLLFNIEDCDHETATKHLGADVTTQMNTLISLLTLKGSGYFLNKVWTWVDIILLGYLPNMSTGEQQAHSLPMLAMRHLCRIAVARVQR